MDSATSAKDLLGLRNPERSTNDIRITRDGLDPWPPQSDIAATIMRFGWKREVTERENIAVELIKKVIMMGCGVHALKVVTIAKGAMAEVFTLKKTYQHS